MEMGRSRRTWLEGATVVVALASIALIGWLDHVVGVAVCLTLFYLLPIAVVAWYRGRWGGLVVSAICAATSLVGDLVPDAGMSSSGFVIGWNAVVRSGVFVLVAVLTARARTALVHQQELAEAERRLAEALASANEAKNTFLRAAAHDFRGPVTAILGNAQVLSDLGDRIDAGERSTIAEAIVHRSEELHMLLEDLLDIDRLEREVVTPNRVPIDLRATVREAVRESGVWSSHEVTIDVDEGRAALDRVMVGRILANLLANVLAHVAPRRPVWVRARVRDDGVLLVVEDAGAGIPLGQREGVFQPFVRADTSSPGMGLGLSLVARFAGMHGGRAWVEERSGGGASFQVRLPADRESSTIERRPA
jgi:signal transduction histidine kinase